MYKESVEMELDEEEKRYQVDIEGGGRETVMARTGKEAIDKVTRKMGIRAHGKRNKMTVKVVEDVDMNEAFESVFETDRHGNTKSFLDAIMNVVSEKKELDPVNKKALKKDFDDRKDKDIDNDGDVDDSDEYLHKRRQAVSKAIEKDSDKAEVDQEKEVSDKEDEPKGTIGKSKKQTKVDVNPSIEEEAEMTDAQMKKREEIVKSMKGREDEFKKKYGDRWKDVMYATATKLAMKK
jgi:predicted RNA-binding protein Jag